MPVVQRHNIVALEHGAVRPLIVQTAGRLWTACSDRDLRVGSPRVLGPQLTVLAPAHRPIASARAPFSEKNLWVFSGRRTRAWR